MNLTLRLPERVSLKLEAITKKTGICKTDLIRLAIVEFLKRQNVKEGT